VAGQWSTIYDQSFKVELDNGLRFLANFKYTVKPEISQDPTQDGADEFSTLKTGDYSKFDTQCDKTMIGFVQTMPKKSSEKGTMSSHKTTCFWGENSSAPSWVGSWDISGFTVYLKFARNLNPLSSSTLND
jgi:hypothetical protein